MNSYDAIFIGAHPDDIVLACSGTVLKLMENKIQCCIVSLTNGDRGGLDNNRIRVDELASSAQILNVAYKVLDFIDTQIYSDVQSAFKMLDLIKRTNPKFIFTHASQDAHPDHQNAYRLVERAIMYSFVRHNKDVRLRLQSLFTFPPIRMTLSNFRAFHPNFTVDISPFIVLKESAIKAHASQMPAILRNMRIMLNYNRMIGNMQDLDYAEAFHYKHFHENEIQFNHVF